MVEEAIMTMLKQMVETRSWKDVRALIDNGRCRICNRHSETEEHLVAGGMCQISKQ